MAGAIGRHRRTRNAAHVQLRDRVGRGGEREIVRPGDRSLPRKRRQGGAAGHAGGRQGRSESAHPRGAEIVRARTAILISGRGSNMASLIAAAADPAFPAGIVLVISNVGSAEGLKHAAAAGIATKAIPHKAFASREAFDAALDAALGEAGVQIVCLAGFMRILSDWFVRKWEGRLLNIHPSLLPAFKGVRVHEQALQAGVRVSGCTVHFVVRELDAGPIVAQAAVPVKPDDTPDTLAARVLQAEHKLYPAALRQLAEGKVKLKNGRAVFA
ncbi:MAG: phosphoribosylglycinamide formyltransferase [Alphaproteobacteria bacterium]|nr:phosphoribosylglycinamide formyltransferase [Alphaproteobacteria bacterium]MDE2630249.1 phosphoribosylglycinamide formyltransferase [Alphaproteobacteria bacterium]